MKKRRILSLLLVFVIAMGNMTFANQFNSTSRKDYSFGETESYYTTGSAISISTDSSITLNTGNLGEYVEIEEYDIGNFYMEDEENYITEISGEFLNKELNYKTNLTINNGFYEYFNKDIEGKDNWNFTILALIPGKNDLKLTFTDINNYKTEYKFKIVSGNQSAEKILRLPTKDVDNDNLLEYMELIYGTDINNPDTDEDGLSDYEELVLTQTSPLESDTDGNGISDGKEDIDGDRLTSLEEIKYNTNPAFKDSDADGLSDYDEIKRHLTDPNEYDTDEDGLSDFEEVSKYKTDPNNPDTDGDGTFDGMESISKLKGRKERQIITVADIDEDTIPAIYDGGAYTVNNILNTTEYKYMEPHMYAGNIGYVTEVYVPEGLKTAKLIYKYKYDTYSTVERMPTLMKYNEETGILDVVPGQILEKENNATGYINLENVETGFYVAVDLITFNNYLRKNQYKSNNNSIKNTINLIFYSENIKNVRNHEDAPEFEEMTENVINHLISKEIEDSAKLNKVGLYRLDGTSSTSINSLTEDLGKALSRLYIMGKPTNTVSSGKALDNMFRSVKSQLVTDKRNRNKFEENLPWSPWEELSTYSGDPTKNWYLPKTGTHVILLSDGNLDMETDIEKWNEMNQADIKLHTVCAGLKEDEKDLSDPKNVGKGTKPEVLRSLSNRLRGESFDIGQIKELETFLIRTVDEVTSREGVDKDTDSDGLPDRYEDNILTSFGNHIKTNKELKDTDSDGLLDSEEIKIIQIPDYIDPTELPLMVATQPESLALLQDTDGDSILDGEEDEYHKEEFERGVNKVNPKRSYDFTDRTLAILSQMSYFDIIKEDESNNRDLMRLIDSKPGYKKEINDKLGDKAHTDELKGIYLVKKFENKETGYYGYLVRKGNNYVFVNRGTDMTSLDDWFPQNFKTIFEFGRQDLDVINVTEEIFINYLGEYSELNITGHSLGGRLTLTSYYKAIKLNKYNRIGKVVTLNGAGIPVTSIFRSLIRMENFNKGLFGRENILDMDGELMKYREKIKEYGIKGDPLTGTSLSRAGIKHYSKYFNTSNRVYLLQNFVDRNLRGGVLTSFKRHNIENFFENFEFYPPGGYNTGI